MFGYAYPMSYTHDTAQKSGGVFYRLGKRVRARFSRQSKPIDHIGGLTPEEMVPRVPDAVRLNHPRFDLDQDLGGWPKKGSTHEDMDVCIG